MLIPASHSPQRGQRGNLVSSSAAVTTQACTRTCIPEEENKEREGFVPKIHPGHHFQASCSGRKGVLGGSCECVCFFLEPLEEDVRVSQHVPWVALLIWSTGDRPWSRLGPVDAPFQSEVRPALHRINSPGPTVGTATQEQGRTGVCGFRGATEFTGTSLALGSHSELGICRFWSWSSLEFMAAAVFPP